MTRLEVALAGLAAAGIALVLCELVGRAMGWPVAVPVLTWVGW